MGGKNYQTLSVQLQVPRDGGRGDKSDRLVGWEFSRLSGLCGVGDIVGLRHCG